MKNILVIFAAVIVFVGLVFTLSPQIKSQTLQFVSKTLGWEKKTQPNADRDLTPGKHTFTGEYVCLPHKNADGPQTLECALGMLADNGSYFALDTQSLDPSVGMTPTGTRITVEGAVVLAEALSSDHWQKYNIAGIIRVERFERM